MPLVTAYLYRKPTSRVVGEGYARNIQSLMCSMCNESYYVDYESSCTDPSDLEKVLYSAQIVIDREHFAGHQDAKVEVANTIHPSEERAQQLIKEMKDKVEAYHQMAS